MTVSSEICTYAPWNCNAIFNKRISASNAHKAVLKATACTPLRAAQEIRWLHPTICLQSCFVCRLTAHPTASPALSDSYKTDKLHS